MASTYENDLRLEEMATGENSGSWGTKTNTNLELVADAFSYGTETIADADTAITIADGAADAARSLALKINSSEDLTTTRVVTLGPNTTSKVWIIENNTSGGQTLTISAGSGSNITLANGTTKIIATDGIGAGSNVVELTQDIAIADMSVDGTLTVDGILSLADGTNSAPSLTNTGDTNTGLYFPAADEVGITVGGTQVFKADSTGANVTGTLVSDGLTVDGPATITTTGNETQLTLTSTDADANIGPRMDLHRDSASPANNDLIGDIRYLGENDASEIIEYANIESKILDVTDGAEDGLMDLRTVVAGTSRSRITILSDETVVNDGGQDLNFRVESDGVSNMLLVDAANNKIGLKTSSPQTTLHVDQGADSNGITLAYSVRGSQRTEWQLSGTNNENSAFFHNNGTNTQLMLLMGRSEITINGDENDTNFRVASDSNTNMLFVDAGQNNVGIGKAPGSGQGTLQIAPQVAATNYYRPAGNYALFGDSGGDGEKDWLYLSGSYTDTDKSVGFAMQDYNGNFGNYAGSYIRTNQAKVRIGHFVGGANSGTAPSLADNFIFDTAGGAVFNERGENGDFRVESDGTAHALFVDASADQVLFGASSANITTASAYFATNTTSYHLAIGNTSTASTASTIYLNRQSGNGNIITFRRTNVDVGYISVTTSGTTYLTTSDRRLKDNIDPIADGTEKLMAMKPVTHTWKADPEADAVHGFIAQEMMDVVPEAVSGDPDGEEMMSMDYGRITPVLVAALQDAHNKITALETRLAEMEAN